MSHLLIGVIGIVSVVMAVLVSFIGVRLARPSWHEMSRGLAWEETGLARGQKFILGLLWLACLAAISWDGIEVVKAGTAMSGIVAEAPFLWYASFAIIVVSGFVLYNHADPKAKDLVRLE